MADEFEAIVIGTGFGGAVTACRLVEAGCKICVLERGRRYGPEDFPEFPTKNLFAHDQTPDEPSTSPLPDISRLLWSRDRGIYDIRDLGDAVSVQAAGYGGGSLVYANVHLRPPRDLFEHGWPEVYRNLDSYFDLAAYMLQVAPVPKRLAKTLQLERAAKSLREKPDPNILWFRTPLAVNFEPIDRDPFEHKRHACDMRGRCWLGCDIQAKNTLDLNYLARAERGDPTPDIRTLAEVTRITRRRHGGFTVTYTDHLVRDAGGNPQRRVRSVEGDFVFLCAGAVNSTELLLKNPQLFERSPVRTRLGSHYFPNADSLSVVFDCDEPHEADYGPTITSAVLFQRPVEGPCSRSLDFHRGVLKRGQPRAAAGQTVVGVTSKARAELTHDPILDWGRWRSGDAAGTLVFSGDAPFQDGEELLIGDSARAVARSQVAHLGHWFLAEDGGFPTDLEPLIGMFRSPLWLRRNRYLEAGERPERAPRRPAQAARLRVKAVANALGGTARRAVTPGGVTTRFFDQQQLPLTSTQVEIGSKRLPLADVLGDNLQKILPKWFLGALQNDRTQFLQNAAAAALPVIGRLLDVVARDLARQLDPATLSQFNFGSEVAGVKKEVLIRGMLRQALQVIAGSEAAIADKAIQQLGTAIPNTLEDLLDAVGVALVWALGYRTHEGHAGMILTMGRDLYRGRLFLQDGHLTARLPGQLLDPSSVMQERVLRTIAMNGWHGELRTNPAWSALGNRITVHSQGGCPMSSRQEFGVTNEAGEVYQCPGLYVMDAAAFPTSVGVNPSATIAAVAEFKVERFIRDVLGKPGWQAVDTAKAARWIADKRGALDPLNPPTASNEEPKVKPLGLKFEEKMTGFYAPFPRPAVDNWGDLSTFPTDPDEFTRVFESAEDDGVRLGNTIDVHLRATVSNLGQYLAVAATGRTEPIEIGHKGFQLSTIPGVTVDSGRLELFIAPPQKRKPPVLFARYTLELRGEANRRYTLNGLKVLYDQPGFDIWHDTSTVYFEITDRPTYWRGIMRVPAQDFLETELPSMTITGTNDPARMSWALTSFYRYFAGQLSSVYVRRQRDLSKLFAKVLRVSNV